MSESVSGRGGCHRASKDILWSVDRGEDTQGEKEAEQQGATVAELAAEYLERHAKLKKRHWREDERMLRVDILPK